MILFTADWHIKLGQKNVPKEWALNRYQSFFEQISAIEPSITLHIIGGDVFDRLPTMEELEIYFEFIGRITVPTIIYDGNHEATKKYKTFFTQLIKATKLMNPLVTIVDSLYEDAEYTILPYTELHRKGVIEGLNASLPLFTHVRAEIPPHVKPEIDLSRLDGFPVVFAGDLHAHSNTQRNIVYPGSPMTISFHRKEVETGYLLINPENWAWEWKAFELPQLIRKTVSDPAEMIPTEYHHTIYELEGNIKDLSSVKNSELLDKKVVKRSTEATLLLNKNMSMGQKLAEYLTYIMQITDEKQLDTLIGLFNDYAKKT